MARVVGDVMSRNPRTIRGHDRLTKAAKLMRAADAGAVIVREGAELRGVLTDRDIVVRVIAAGRNPADVQASEVCSQRVATVRPDDEIDHALVLMRRHHVRRLPVVDEGHPIGIVSLGDIAVDRDPGSALGEISAAPGNR